MKIPALSQSRHGDMACETLYARKHVRGGRTAESAAATRGIEIHEVLAAYLNHLILTRRWTDLGTFDGLLKGTSAGTREVLERFRENHAFDPENILGTELHIALDEDFHPIGSSEDDARTAKYEGTLDLVLLHSVTEAEIADWKSYYQIINADTFQSKFYPLLLMCLNPSLERVKFVLEFVRFGTSRCVEYTRKDLPGLKELARAERARQRKLHELVVSNRRNLKASPGRHCTWCPLLLKGCPVAKTNPYSQMSGEERLRFALWLREAERQNTEVLKGLVAEHGPIRCHDGNQNEYLADFVPVEKTFYPYRETISVLEGWFRAHPEDAAMSGNLTISGLSAPLQARKREALGGQLLKAVRTRVDTELKIGRAGEGGRKNSGR
jgi:hypothetical protein